MSFLGGVILDAIAQGRRDAKRLSYLAFRTR
jgi:hypothetical protein